MEKRARDSIESAAATLVLRQVTQWDVWQNRAEFIFYSRLSTSNLFTFPVCVWVCAPLLFMYSNVLKMINSSISPTMGLGIDRVPFNTVGMSLLHLFVFFIFYFVRFYRGFYLFSCYLFDLMEQKTIAFIGKRFCHAHIDFIAKVSRFRDYSMFLFQSQNFSPMMQWLKAEKKSEYIRFQG